MILIFSFLILYLWIIFYEIFRDWLPTTLVMIPVLICVFFLISLSWSSPWLLWPLALFF